MSYKYKCYGFYLDLYKVLLEAVLKTLWVVEEKKLEKVNKLLEEKC